MIHKQGIKAVSDQHLLRRSGVYYYRRRVPLSVVEKIGKKVIQHSLKTSSFKEAKKRRTVCDLEWDARFDAYSILAAHGKAAVQTSAQNSSLTATELTQLVRSYVERQDQAAEKRDASCHPVTASERKEMRTEAEFEAQTLQARDDLHHQWIYLAGTEALKAAGKSFNDPDVAGETLAELVRRGLLELNRRHRARLADDHGRSFFDQFFDPARPAMLTFGKLAEQHLRLIEEDAAINGLGAKGLDRQRATRRLIRRGFQVVFAMDGQQGIDLARSEQPDIILMDMGLPVVDGWEATRRVKADDATRSVPVIGLTAHAMSGDREKTIEAGCDDYDTKPVEFDRLIRKIERLIGTAKV